MGVKNILAGHKDYKTGKVVIPSGNPKAGLLSSAQALAKGKVGKKSGVPGFNLSKVVPFKPQKDVVADGMSLRSNIGAPTVGQKKQGKHSNPRAPYDAVLVKGAGPHGIKLGTRSERYSVALGPGKSGITWRDDPKGGVVVESIDANVIGAKNKRIKPEHHLMTIQGQDVSSEMLKNQQSPLALLMDETKTLKLELMTLPKRHVVVGIADGSAAKKTGKIRVGHILKAVGTTDISNMTNEEAIKIVGSVERPHTLTLVGGAHHHHHHHHHARKHNIKAQIAKEIAPRKQKGPDDPSSDSEISSSSGSGSSSSSSSSSSSGNSDSDDEAMAGLNNQVNSSKVSGNRKGESASTLARSGSDASPEDDMEMRGLSSTKIVGSNSKESKISSSATPPPPPGKPAKPGTVSVAPGAAKQQHHHHHHHKNHRDKAKSKEGKIESDSSSGSSSSSGSGSGSSSSGNSSESSSSSDSD